ncbi:MAG: cell wall-binding repeat-containing protein [Cryobacterium sp.]|nr:cell wall-binding repeat-containing protein [Cryobacterium sp.]
MRTDTYDRAADRNICTNYVGANGELTSTIIFKVQKACGISAKVIIVTLQKEQGLITNTGPSDGKLQRAMGYGCPDTTGGTCDAKYWGLYNQIYQAAWQFKRYSTPTPWGSYQPGIRNIQYKPGTSCGTLEVNIENNATAALYNYTPYVPNAAALANLGGPGDSCSSYGNRNFWAFYNNWFGDTHVIIPQNVTVDRIGGSDRYDVAIGISQKNFPATASVVYIATGSNFPDALSAAPAAALQKAPLLLTPSDSLPAKVKSEIQRLAPTTIVVVGGPASVSDNVYAQLSTLAPNIRREGGPDRYAVAESIIRNAFTAGSQTVYLATGATFPDALSASAAAGSIKAPVLLVDGQLTGVSPELVSLITSLGAKHIIIAGGPASVTPELESGLAAVSGVEDVKRVSGSDRFIVSGQINRDAFETATRVYVAAGFTYPDALSGAAVAGAQSAPLYVIPGPCVPSYVLQDIKNFGATEMTLLGGPASVSPSVERFAQCR